MAEGKPGVESGLYSGNTMSDLKIIDDSEFELSPLSPVCTLCRHLEDSFDHVPEGARPSLKGSRWRYGREIICTEPLIQEITGSCLKKELFEKYSRFNTIYQRCQLITNLIEEEI
jgi:hypothetical protein